jgi:diguanylate cyclase (GGDEF)-like protein/PAS domain S-box-containing protein
MRFHSPAERKIILSWALVLAVVVATTLGAAVWLLRSQTERWLTQGLSLALEAHTRLLAREIRLQGELAEFVARTPGLAAAVRGLPAARARKAAEEALAASLARLPGGASVTLLDARDQALLALGPAPGEVQVRLPIQGNPATWLAWAGAPLLVSRLELTDERGFLATLVLARPVPALLASTTGFHHFGESGELAICGGALPDRMDCLPTRLTPRVLTNLPRVVDGRPLPMARALAGGKGVVTSTDYRRQTVLAAFAPVEATGLGMVLKADQAELLAPVAGRLAGLAPLVVALVVLGVVLLRWQVLPLVRQVLVAERRARLASASLATAEARVRAVLDNVGEGILTINERGEVENYNLAAQGMFGHAPEAVLGRSVNQLLPNACGADGRVCIEAASAATATAPVRREMMGRRADGSSFPVEVRASRVAGSHSLLVIAVRDLSEHKAQEARLWHHAHHDALTGLPNRALLQDRLRQALAQAERTNDHVGVLFLDLDHFKTINDSLGHAVGDRLLKMVAARIQGCLREGDTVARQGGDEFIVVLPGLTRFEDVGLVAGKILAAVAAPYVLDDNELYTGASIGAAVFPEDGRDVDTLLRHADVAMYHAKSMGRANYQFFAPEMNRAAAERLNLENNLRHALARQELRLEFQPIVSLSSGVARGAEALLRWHAQSGPITPDRFIPVAEETGLIVPIGEWVLREACAQFKAWQAQGCGLERVVVNLSARQFAHRNLLSAVRRALAEAELAPEHLGLEITESLLMANPLEAIRVLTVLSDMGIQISVDDFGTGYSSLSYLKRFPIHKIKIDRSFVRDVVSDKEDAAIVTAIIAMAHSLDCTVVAEGVETEAQLAFLRARGCDEYQGYYFSRPLPTSALVERVCRVA